MSITGDKICFICFLALLIVGVICFFGFRFRKELFTGKTFEYELANETDPFIQPKILFGFLSPEECDEIRRLGEKKGFTRSQLEDGKEDDAVRTSETCWIHPETEMIVDRIYKRIRELPEVKMMNDDVFMEALQVVRYGQGNYYKSHYDQCHDKVSYCIDQIKEFTGPRKWTLLLYLNDDYDGGETEFVALDRRVKGRKGDALLFHSLTNDDTRVHPLSLHQGVPVRHGQKYIANVWIRKKQII